MMKQTSNLFGKPMAAACAAAALWLAAASLGAADHVWGKAFDSPKAAADALIKAASAGDAAALIAIFGPDGKEIVTTGDAVADKNRMTEFAKLGKEKTEIDFEGAKKAVVVVGNNDWPLPVPLVQRNGKWYFDTEEGKEEILNRRIGENELDTINLLRGYVEAQQEYASVSRDGGVRQYAQRIVSTPGKQDGLSWKNADGSYGGPMGDEVAAALEEGYSDKTKPYNGYYIRRLTAQGPAARLGARDYVYKGMMIGGFAVIAWPATYGVTGIQTFQVNADGIVYQKDLGPETAKIAPTINAYNPDSSWIITEDGL